MENTYLLNGRFLHNLNGWTVSDSAVVYSAGDGDDHYGVAVLPTGNKSIEQVFNVDMIRSFVLHVAVKAVGAALTAGQAVIVIEDGNGNTVTTLDLVAGTADTWVETTYSIGLAQGTAYTLRVKNVNAAGDVKIDDLWLWFVPITRAEISVRVASKLGTLASDQGYTTTASGALTEGSYTHAIDAALRNVGAIDDDTGQIDIRYLDEWTTQSAINYTENEILLQLQSVFSSLVDVSIGPYSESYSQLKKNVDEMLANAKKLPPVILRR